MNTKEKLILIIKIMLVLIVVPISVSFAALKTGNFNYDNNALKEYDGMKTQLEGERTNLNYKTTLSDMKNVVTNNPRKALIQYAQVFGLRKGMRIANFTNQTLHYDNEDEDTEETYKQDTTYYWDEYNGVNKPVAVTYGYEKNSITYNKTEGLKKVPLFYASGSNTGNTFNIVYAASFYNWYEKDSGTHKNSEEATQQAIWGYTNSDQNYQQTALYEANRAYAEYENILEKHKVSNSGDLKLTIGDMKDKKGGSYTEKIGGEEYYLIGPFSIGDYAYASSEKVKDFSGSDVSLHKNQLAGIISGSIILNETEFSFDEEHTNDPNIGVYYDFKDGEIGKKNNVSSDEYCESYNNISKPTTLEDGIYPYPNSTFYIKIKKSYLNGLGNYNTLKGIKFSYRQTVSEGNGEYATIEAQEKEFKLVSSLTSKHKYKCSVCGYTQNFVTGDEGEYNTNISPQHDCIAHTHEHGSSCFAYVDFENTTYTGTSTAIFKCLDVDKCDQAKSIKDWIDNQTHDSYDLPCGLSATYVGGVKAGGNFCWIGYVVVDDDHQTKDSDGDVYGRKKGTYILDMSDLDDASNNFIYIEGACWTTADFINDCISSNKAHTTSCRNVNYNQSDRGLSNLHWKQVDGKWYFDDSEDKHVHTTACYDNKKCSGTLKCEEHNYIKCTSSSYKETKITTNNSKQLQPLLLVEEASTKVRKANVEISDLDIAISIDISASTHINAVKGGSGKRTAGNIKEADYNDGYQYNRGGLYNQSLGSGDNKVTGEVMKDLATINTSRTGSKQYYFRLNDLQTTNGNNYDRADMMTSNNAIRGMFNKKKYDFSAQVAALNNTNDYFVKTYLSAVSTVKSLADRVGGTGSGTITNLLEMLAQTDGGQYIDTKTGNFKIPNTNETLKSINKVLDKLGIERYYQKDSNGDLIINNGDHVIKFAFANAKNWYWRPNEDIDTDISKRKAEKIIEEYKENNPITVEAGDTLVLWVTLRNYSDDTVDVQLDYTLPSNIDEDSVKVGKWIHTDKKGNKVGKITSSNNVEGSGDRLEDFDDTGGEEEYFDSTQKTGKGITSIDSNGNYHLGTLKFLPSAATDENSTDENSYIRLKPQSRIYYRISVNIKEAGSYEESNPAAFTVNMNAYRVIASETKKDADNKLR